MAIFLKIEKMLNQLRREVLKDEGIRKLLYYGTPDALEQEDVPTIEDVEQHVYISNYVDRKKHDNQHAFIAIYTTGFSNEDNITNVELQIAAYAWESTYMLNNGRNRTLQLLHRVYQNLENRKIAFTGSLNFVGANLEGYDNGQVLGYVSTWGVVDHNAITQGI